MLLPEKLPMRRQRGPGARHREMSSVPSPAQHRSQRRGHPSISQDDQRGGQPGARRKGSPEDCSRWTLTSPGRQKAGGWGPGWGPSPGDPPLCDCRLPRADLWARVGRFEGTLPGTLGAWTWGRWSLGVFRVSGQMELSRNGGPLLGCPGPPREGEGLSESWAGALVVEK